MQRTHSFKKAEVERKWYVVDLADQVLGRSASRIASILRGKHKPQYTPNADTGDFVVAINAEKVRLTGKKRQEKTYFHHSGYIGNLKSRTAAEILTKKPEEIITLAVRGMLPHTSLGRRQLKKLRVYAGPDHPHAAQQPTVLDLATKVKEKA